MATNNNNNNARKPASSKPRASRVRVIKADPATLETVNLSSATQMLPDHLRAALLTAKAEADARRQRAAKTRSPRVSVTADEAQGLAAMGWQPPYVDANLTVAPQPRQRYAACKGEAAYDAAAAILTADQTLKVTELAALWLAIDGKPKALNAILQQIANRAQRTIKQKGLTISAA
jgi:hypothetical protein